MTGITESQARAIAEALGWVSEQTGHEEWIWIKQDEPETWHIDMPTLETDDTLFRQAVEWLASRGTLQLDVYERGAMVEITGGDGYLKESLPAALRAAMLQELGR